MPQEPSLTIRRHIKAAPAKIFAAWTDPAQLVQWFGPPGGKVDETQIDVQVGARYRIVFHAPDGEEHGVSGIYREVVRNEKLVFTWAWRTMPERESLVTLTMTPEGEGTLFTLLHERFFDEAARDRHRTGWTAFVGKLARFLEPVVPARIETAGPFAIAGFEERYGFTRMAELPLQWQRFAQAIPGIPGKIAGTAYGVVRGGPDGFDYLTGIAVTGAAAPAGMSLLRIPAQRYAVFPHEGHVAQIRATIEPALHGWLPASGHAHAGMPTFIERYGPGFDPVRLSGDIEIWIPLKD